MREAPAKALLRKAREKLIPHYATFELTYRCNLRCVHCYLEEDAGDELTTMEVFSVIDQLAEAGTLEMTFTGGEVLLRDDFFDIAAYARKRNMAVTLISNGTLIDESVAERMKELRFSALYISLYGVTPETHEAVTTVPGSFSKTYKAIRLLRREGFKVQVKGPVMRQNVEETSKIAEFCDDIGADFVSNPLLCATTKGSDRPLQYRLSDEELRTHVLWELGNGKKASGLTGMCNAGSCIVSISARGKVLPCIMLRLEAGDLRHESFHQIWNYSPVLEWVRGITIEDFKECCGCEFLGVCNRCPGHALSNEGSMLAPLKEACRISNLRKEVENEQQDCRGKEKGKGYQEPERVSEARAH